MESSRSPGVMSGSYSSVLLAVVESQRLQVLTLTERLTLTKGLLEDKEAEVAEQDGEIEILHLARKEHEKERRAMEETIESAQRVRQELEKERRVWEKKIGEEQERGRRAVSACNASNEKEIHRLVHASTYKDSVIVRLGLAEAELSKEVAGLRRAGEEAGKQARTGQVCESLAAAKDAAKDAELERLRGAGEEQEKRGPAFCLESHQAIAGLDAQIQQLAQANNWLLASRDAAGAVIAGKDAEIVRLGLASEEQAKEVAGLRRAGELLCEQAGQREGEWRGVLAARDGEIQRLIESTTARDAEILRHVQSIDVLSATGKAELAAKDGEIVRLGLAEEKLSEQVAWLRRAREEAGEKEAAQLRAKDEELLRASEVLTAKDGEISRLGLAGRELAEVGTGLRRAGEQAGAQVRQLLQANEESARAGLAALAAKDGEIAAKDGEIFRLGLAGEEVSKRWRAVNACDAKEILRLVGVVAARDEAIARLGLAEGAREKERDAALAVKNREIARLGLAWEELGAEIAGLRRARARVGELQARGERARAELAAKDGEIARMGLAELAAKDGEIARMGLAGEENERGWRTTLEERGKEIQKHVRSIEWHSASWKASNAALAHKEEAIVRFGLAEEELVKEIAGLRRSGAQVGERARQLQASEESLGAELLLAREEQETARLAGEEQETELAVKEEELAAKDGEIARIGLAEGTLSKEVAVLRRAGEKALKAGERSKAALAFKEAEIKRLRLEKTEQGRGLKTLGKRCRVSEEAASELEERLVKAKLEKQEAEEDLEESRETLGHQIHATDSLMTKVDDLVALALAGGADAAAVTAIKLRSLC